MVRLIIILVIILVLANFAEYKALIYAYKRKGIIGVIRMIFAVIVHLIGKILPE